MISRAESDKKKAHADLSMKLVKMFMRISNLNICPLSYFQDGGT